MKLNLLSKTTVDAHMPKGGLNRATSFTRQPAVVIDPQANVYARTTYRGVNVRAYDTGDRRRGGSRSGLTKYLDDQVDGSATLVQMLQMIAGVGYSPPGGTVQGSNSGRVVTLVAVSNGNIKTADAGATSWHTPAGGGTLAEPQLNTSGLPFSAPNGQKLYFVDGTNYVVYDPAADKCSTWAATAGTLPVGSDMGTARLICTWRGRTVLSGLVKDPHNWFMSRQDDPLDYDYSPASPSASDAVAGNNSPLGLVGDVITALVPLSDDVLLVGGDHTLFVFRGDPLAGGQIDRLSDAIGMCWGAPWCKDPMGNLYFVSNRMGIYVLDPQATQLRRISQPIENIVQSADTGANTITLGWDDRFQGLHVFVTATAAPATATHLFWEWRANAWWMDQFATSNHNPLCNCVFDGNLPGDRVLLIGSWDGYVRWLDPDATDDDGAAIASSVVIGPLVTPVLDDIELYELQAVLGEDSGDVTYSVYVGRSAEAALASSPVITGTFTASRNLTRRVGRAGHAVYVKLSSVVPWMMEAIRLKFGPLGKLRQRGR